MTECTCCAQQTSRTNTEALVPGELSVELERLRAVGFELLFEGGAPVLISALAERAGWTVEATAARLEDIEGIGRARRNAEGDLVAIAGLSVEPTAHTLEIDGRRFWTWCALDAVGILTALKASGVVTSVPPNGDDVLTIEYERGATESEYALFLSDRYDESSVYDSWCVDVNFFPSVESAEGFAENIGLSGEAVAISEVSEMAEAVWAPVVAGLTR